MIIHINQDVDIDDLLEEIDFAKGIGIDRGNPYHAIPLYEVYRLLYKYFPQIKEQIDGQCTTG